MNLDVSQEDAAVLNAIRQVREGTGFGCVVVEVKDGQIIFIEKPDAKKAKFCEKTKF